MSVSRECEATVGFTGVGGAAAAAGESAVPRGGRAGSVEVLEVDAL